MILIAKQQKYLLYNHLKVINMNILQIKSRIIEQAMFTYSSLGKALKNKYKR